MFSGRATDGYGQWEYDGLMRTIKATDARFLVVSVVSTGYGEATSVDSTVCKCETRVSFSSGSLAEAIVVGSEVESWSDDCKVKLERRSR